MNDFNNPNTELEFSSSIYMPLLLAVMLFWLVFIWIWPPAYLTLTVDDSFYYLKSAMNIAAGDGITFDQINPTNGFHPLWMVILSVVALFCGDDARIFMQVSLSIQLFLLIFGIVVAARINPLPGSRYGLVMAIVLTNFYFAKIVINGQESALQFFLLSILLSLWWKYGRETYQLRHAAYLGILAALCTLARLDASVFGVIVLIMPLVWPSETQKQWTLKARITYTGVSFTLFALVLLPYFIWNQVTFGHLMPVSGAIKFEASSFSMLKASTIIAAVATLLLLYSILLRYAQRNRQTNGYAFLRYLFPLLAYVIFETVYVTGIRGQWIPEIWYLAPYLMLAGWVITGLMHYIKRFRPRVRLLVVSSMLILHTLFAFSVWKVRLQPISYSANASRADTGRWISLHTPKDARIGSWNAGILGAHANRKLINLDGLINSWEYKESYLDTGMVSHYINNVANLNFIAEYEDLRQMQYNLKKGVAFMHGVNLSSWYVAYAKFAPFASITNPKKVRPLIHLVLSRNPCDTCRLKYVDYMKLAVQEYELDGYVSMNF